MADIDCHNEMTKFHREYVTLKNPEQTDMRSRRNAGRTRLNSGLNVAQKPLPVLTHSQGSYAMRTMVQDAESDYDIDDGAYFALDDLKDQFGVELTPVGARQRVCDALKWDGRLKHEATVKRNCVRQEYPAGYHIDVPVYRVIVVQNENSEPVERYELASGDSWVESDARAVTNWFNNIVGTLNAGQSDGSQMRRITKLTKKFSRRLAWKEQTTGGICITKLVVDNFNEHTDRDDKSLRETWQAIFNQLQRSTEIKHPVLSSNLASVGDDEVEFFRDCLKEALETLQVLDQDYCTRIQARKAWDDVFDTSFFSNVPNGGDDGEAKKAATVTSSEAARRNDGGGRFG